MAETKDKLVTLEDLKEAYDNTVHADDDYVMRIKGNAEANYRTGEVNLTPANIGAKPLQTAKADPTAGGTATQFIATITQDANGVIAATKKTVASASTSAAGLMSAADKTKLNGITTVTTSSDGLMTAADKVKLNGIAAGASVTGVKGEAETSYRTGAVALTPDHLGLFFKLDTATWSDVYSQFSKMIGGKSAFVWVHDNVAASLFGTSNLAWTSGTVTNTGSGNYRLSLMTSDGILYHLTITGLTSASATPTVDVVSRDVTGVKGNAEVSYRYGNVNLTPANLGIVDATTSASGLMSAADKVKLDGAILILDGSTWAAIYQRLATIPNNRTATFFVSNSTAAGLISPGAPSSFGPPARMQGLVSRFSTTTFNFMAWPDNGSNIYTWRITNATSSGRDNVARIIMHAGTVLT